MPKTIEIKIPLEGLASGKVNMTAHVEGVKGASCMDETKKLIEQTVISSTPTDEYYQRRDEVVVGRVG